MTLRLPRLNRRFAFWAVIVGLNLFVIEAGAGVVVWRLSRKGAIFRPPSVHQVESYLALRDPLLGWPSSMSFGGPALDRSGARRLPSFPEPGKACISVYGDSFAVGEEVDDAAVWTNQLSMMLQCRVANYGTSGYGADQAFLRFAGVASDESDVVILGYFSDDIVRSVNQLRNLLAPGRGIGFKPRFVLDSEGTLRLIPPDTFPAERLEEVVRYPERFLTHEFFLPGGPSGLVRAEFPYTLTLVRSLRSYKVKAALQGRSPYEDFYRSDHPSGALDLTARICQAFFDEAVRRHKKPLLLLFPAQRDLQNFSRTGQWVYEPLLHRLKKSGHAALDLGPHFITHLNGRHPREVFLNIHYNATGNALVARAVAEALTRK